MVKFSGFYLEQGDAKKPSVDDWAGYRAEARTILENWGVTPNWQSVSTLRRAGKYRPFKGGVLRTLTEAPNDWIDSFSFATTTPDSISPGYDAYVRFGVGYSGLGGDRLHLHLLVQSDVIEIGSNAFDDGIRRLINLADWDFGWGLERDEKRNPSMFLSGEGDGPGLSRRDRRDMTRWYESHQADARCTKLRDIFTYMVINRVQRARIERALAESPSLSAGFQSSIEEFSNGLTLWRPPLRQIARIKKTLEKNDDDLFV